MDYKATFSVYKTINQCINSLEALGNNLIICGGKSFMLLGKLLSLDLFKKKLVIIVGIVNIKGSLMISYWSIVFSVGRPFRVYIFTP